MFEALPEARDDGAVIGRRAATIAVCAHVMVLAGVSCHFVAVYSTLSAAA